MLCAAGFRPQVGSKKVEHRGTVGCGDGDGDYTAAVDPDDPGGALSGGGNEITAYIQAGPAAVRLLKRLAEMVPLRSDMPAILSEIARIDNIFKRRDNSDG
jgi:hypothetical protein